MNMEIGANPNVAWPRRVAAGLVVAIGAAGCSAAGPQEIAKGQQQIDPIECPGSPVDGFEVEPSVEAVRQNIDALLCETANEAAINALAEYREDGILMTWRDEGPEEDEGVYGFRYANVTGEYVSVEFGMTKEQKPDMSDLRRVRVSDDQFDDEGEVTGSIATSIERHEKGYWTISEYNYNADGQIEEAADGFYYNPDFREFQQSIEVLRDAEDKAFAATINFIKV